MQHIKTWGNVWAFWKLNLCTLPPRSIILIAENTLRNSASISYNPINKDHYCSVNFSLWWRQCDKQKIIFLSEDNLSIAIQLRPGKSHCSDMSFPDWATQRAAACLPTRGSELYSLSGSKQSKYLLSPRSQGLQLSLSHPPNWCQKREGLSQENKKKQRSSFFEFALIFVWAKWYFI